MTNLFWGLLAIALLLALALAAFVQLADDAPALRAAQAVGWHDAHVVERGIVTIRCADDDATYFVVEGFAAQGNRVRATVCCGWMKACTLRVQ
jgi:hypothetical protein